MIRQIRFEFQKNFLKKSIVAALLVFLVIDAFQIRSLYHEKSVFSIAPEFKQVYETYYERYGGSITEEKITELLALYRPIQSVTGSGAASTDYAPDSIIYNSYSDELFLRWCFVEPMEYDYQYRQNAAEIVKSAAQNMEFYKSVGNEYAYHQNEQIARLFLGRAITELCYTEMYQFYLQYDFSIFFILLICMYALVNVFVMEKETEMHLLMMTCVNGNRKSVIAKVIASVLFIIGICFFFWIADFILFGIFFGGFRGGSSPVYAVEYFENSPLVLSLFQYGILSVTLKTIGILIFGLLVLLLSCLCKNALIPFVGGVMVIGCGLCAYSVETAPVFDIAALWNPVCLLVNRDLFRNVTFVNVCRTPVLTWLISLGAAVLEILILFAVIVKKARCTYLKA